MSSEIVIIGISGVTCGGKTTLATKLCEILPNCKVLTQDDYFLDVDDKRHVWIPELNHINFDILSSLDMDKMHKDLLQLIENKRIISKHSKSAHQNGTVNVLETVQNQIRKKNIQVLIVEGFCIFNYEPFPPLFNLKYYFTLSKEECFARREQRVYEPPDCPGYFEQCVWPEYLKQLEEVQTKVKDVTYFDINSKSFETVLADIAALLK